MGHRLLNIEIGLAALVLASCLREDPGLMPSRTEDPSGEEEVTVTVIATADTRPSSGYLREGLSLRSLHTPDESLVRDLTVMAYRDGLLTASAYAQTLAGGLSMRLVQDASYDLYAIAGTGGRFTPPEHEDALPLSIVDVDYSLLDSVMPMSGEARGVTVGSGAVSVSIPLRRLMAKFGFRVDGRDLSNSTYTFTSVRLRQTASGMAPFSEGYRAETESSVQDGDGLGSADLEVLNSGGEVFFYVPENCQGTLLPDNNDQWQKVPSSISGREGLCTYLEAESDFVGQGAYGRVTFRFYLGGDNCTNFDVVRNTVSHVVLYPGDDSADASSWKVTADVVREDPPPITFTLDAPAWVGSWGSLSVPGATSEDPVEVTISLPSGSTRTVTLGGSSKQFFSWGSYRYGYNPAEPHMLYFMPDDRLAGGYPTSVLPSFTMRRGGVAATAQVNIAPQYPRFQFLSDLDIVEDGIGCDRSLVLVPPTTMFAVPETVHALLPASLSYKQKKWYYLNDVLYEDFAWSMCDPADFDASEDAGCYPDHTSYASAEDVTLSRCTSLYDAWDDEVFAVFMFYGLGVKDNAATSQYFIPYHDSLYDPDGEYWYQPMDFRVVPAFPDQRYLGTYTNMQLAPDSRVSDTATLDFSGGASGLRPADGATWDVRHASFDPADAGERLAQTWSDGYADVYSRNISLSGSRMTFSADLSSAFFPCGGMIARGSVTNAVTGRVIEGYYTFDLVLYMSAGVQVAQDGFRSGFCICPFNRYSRSAYYDRWAEDFLSIPVVYEVNAGGTVQQRTSMLLPPEYPDTDPSDWNDFLQHQGQSVSSSSSFTTLAMLYGGLYANGALDFKFRTFPNDLVDELDITRDSFLTNGIYSPFRQTHLGEFGYYYIQRQCDVGTIPDTYSSGGLQNVLLECAYGSFRNW